MYISKFFEFIIPKNNPKLLGRWGLKTCRDLQSAINSINQNRDHCGDVICKTPKKASEYIKPLKDIKDE